MKQLIILTIALFLTGCATTLPPAGPASSAMEKADAIWILSDDEPETAYRKTDAGYSISSSDAVLMNITTEPFQPKETLGSSLSSGGMKVTINASVRESNGKTAVKLTGKFLIPPPYGSDDNEIQNRGAKSSYTGRSWSELEKIAKSYSGGTLEYTRNM